MPRNLLRFCGAMVLAKAICSAGESLRGVKQYLSLLIFYEKRRSLRLKFLLYPILAAQGQTIALAKYKNAISGKFVGLIIQCI